VGLSKFLFDRKQGMSWVYLSVLM